MTQHLEIPKIIFYCWFSNKSKPNYLYKNIETWKKFLPDYKIFEINESNFDVNCNDFCKNAYENGHFAFVSDYARFKMLYKNGGLYFDTDVEIIKPIDDILENGPFLACESEQISAQNSGLVYDIDINVAPGLGCAFEKHNSIVKEIIQKYDAMKNCNKNKTIVDVTTKTLQNYGLKNNNEIQKIQNITIYPKEYFNPKSLYDGKITITENTRSIHFYTMTWLKPWKRFLSKFVIILRHIFGKRIISKIGSLKIFENFWNK